MTQKIPVIPAISDDIPLNARRVLMAMKVTIEYLLAQTGTTTNRFGGSTGSSSTSGSHNVLDGLQGGAANSYFHLSGTHHTDLTDGGESTLHYHESDRALENATGSLAWANVDKAGSSVADLAASDHEDLSAFQGGVVGEHYHLTAAQWLAHTQALDNVFHFHSTDRDLSLHTGELPWDQVSKSGSDVADIEVRLHNQLQGIQGGAVFQPGLFQTGMVQLTGTEHWHLSRANYVNLTSRQTSVAVDTALATTYKSVLVTATAKTMTLPAASAEILGWTWTIMLGVAGYVDITVTGADTINLPVVDDTIRLNTKGAAVSLRCTSATSWSIV